MSVKHLNAAYLAGLFDGEGTVGVYSTNKGTTDNLKLSIANTFVPVLDQIKIQYGGNIYKRAGTCFAWHMDGIKVRTFIETILPYAIIKQEQLNLAIAYLDTFPVVPYRGTWNPIPGNIKLQRRLITIQLREAKAYND